MARHSAGLDEDDAVERGLACGLVLALRMGERALAAEVVVTRLVRARRS